MRKIFLFLALLAIAGGVVAYRIYNKPYKNIGKATADFQVDATKLLADFETDEAAANSQYLDKVVEVTGVVREIKPGDDGGVSVMLEAGSDMAGVLCELDQVYDPGKVQAEPGESITLRGVCTGSLLDVVLVRCVVVE